MKNVINSVLIVLFMSCQDTNQHMYTNISEHLKSFEPYIGKTFKGEFSNSTPEKPVYDISHWERALNGNAIRIMHSVNKGEYGGESIVMWDRSEESLISFYFTTAGFYTQAKLHFEDNKLISIEDVTGNQNGVTKVKAIFDFLPDGGFINSSMYLMNDNWVDGHKIHYKEVSDTQVVFK